MIRLFILAVLFFAVVAISPLLINEKGYILIAMGDLTIESTVVTAIIMLVLSFLGLLLLIKVFRGGVKFGSFTWRKLVFANRRKALRDFNQGIAAYLLKDYSQAEKLMAKCAEASQQAKLAWLVAASAANKQLDNKNGQSNSAHYLKLIAQHSSAEKSANLETVLVTVNLFMQQHAYHQARQVIDEHHKLIGHDARLLSLEIDLCIIEQRFEQAVEYLVAARKQKNITEIRIKEWETVAFGALFQDKIIRFDQQHLYDYWQKLAKKIKQRETILFAYCQVLAANKLFAPLTKLLLPSLKKEASSEFLKQVRLLPIGKADELIVVVQKHLQKQPESAKWVSLLGHLCCASQQWSMADKAFYCLLSLTPKQYDQTDLLAYARSKTQQGLFQQANEILNKAMS